MVPLKESFTAKALHYCKKREESMSGEDDTALPFFNAAGCRLLIHIPRGTVRCAVADSTDVSSDVMSTKAPVHSGAITSSPSELSSVMSTRTKNKKQ